MVFERTSPHLWSGFFVERSTPDPEPSPPSPRCAERKPEPTEDGEPDQRASAVQSDWVEDRPGCRAQSVWAGARAGDHACHKGASRGRWEHGVEHRCWGWAYCASGTAGRRGGPYWLGNRFGDRLAPSPLSFVPAGPVHPSFVSCPHVQPRVGSCFPVQPWERLSPQVQPGVGFDPGGQAWEPGGSRMPTNAPPPLSSGSPSAHLQPTIYKVRAPRFCHPPSSPWLENPSPPPPASEARTPPRTVDPAAPISLASTVTCRSTRLPCPSGSALVGQI